MSGEIALDTSVAVRFLNGDTAIIERVLTLPEVILPLVVAGECLLLQYKIGEQFEITHLFYFRIYHLSSCPRLE